MNRPRTSSQNNREHPVTSEEELAAEHFLQRLRDAAASDDVAFYIMQAFTRNFRAFHEGRMSEADTKSQVTNLLIDEEPTMIDEFMQLFESCCHTRSWAGLAPLYHQSSVAEAHLADLEGGMAPPPLAPSHSGITNISSAPKHEVGTVAGAQRKSKSRRNSKKKGPEGKLEWQAIAKRLVPEGRASYAIWFTVANIGLILAIFAYMAGDYAVWVKEHRQEFSTDSSILSNSDEDAEDLLLNAGRVPQYLQKWLDWRATWQTFSFEFLKYWGGRWAPSLERGGDGGGGAWWLWVTSIYIHQNLNHIVSNLLLFVAMSVHLELNYGWWRLLAVWFISGIGANLVSAAFEPNCTLLVGASGAVFGFMGLFVADLVVNFESISWPFLRVICIVLFVVFFIVNTLSDDSSPRVSHASHVGGLVCGLFPSLLFLPNIRNKRIRALKRQMETGEGPAEGATLNTRNAMEEDLNQSLRQSFWTRSFPINPLYIIGGLVVIAVYVILPIYLYTARLKDVCCDPDVGTSLACNATDAAAGQVAGDVPVGTSDDEVTATFRKLMTPAVDAVADQIGSYIGGRGSQQQGSGSDAWSQYVARG